MAYGAGAFAQGLMGGLQTGLELADVRKQAKREKIAAEVAKGKVPAEGVPTFDAAELAQQERLMPSLTEGMSGDKLVDYASTRRVPLGIERSQALGTPEVDLGALPKVDINAPRPMPRAALPTADAPELVVTAKRPTPKMDYTNVPSAKDEVAAPQYQKYTDILGRERFTTKLRDRSREEVAFDTATRLQQMGDMEGYDKYMQRYDTELERGSKIRAKTLVESSQTLQAGIMLKDPAKVNKGLSGIMNTLQGNPDGMTWGLNRSPDGNELVLTATDTATGLPAPPQIEGYPAGTMAVFKADPTAGLTAEEVMAGQMTALAKGDLAAFTKQIMEGRKAIADIHQSNAAARLSNVKADLAPEDQAIDKQYKLGMLGVQQYEAQTGRMNAVTNRLSAQSGGPDKISYAEDNFKYESPNGMKMNINRYRAMNKATNELSYVYPEIPSVQGGVGYLRPEVGADAVAIQNVLTRANTLKWNVFAGADGRLYFKPPTGKLTLISDKALQKYGNQGRVYNTQ